MHVPMLSPAVPEELAAFFFEQLFLVGTGSLVLHGSARSVASHTVDLASITNLAIGSPELFGCVRCPAVQPVRRLINRADLVRRWITVRHEDVVSLLRHLAARFRDQERGG